MGAQGIPKGGRERAAERDGEEQGGEPGLLDLPQGSASATYHNGWLHFTSLGLNSPHFNMKMRVMKGSNE